MPKGITSTGWPVVEAKCAELGIRFRWWQAPIGKVILAKRVDGKYASTIGGTGLSIPRQVGKTFLVAAIVFVLCLLRPGLTVIWTAHRVRTAEETFKKMQVFAKRRRIAPHIAKIVLGSGEEAILFTNGSRILFGARAKEFGRGFDEVDVLIFDEAQILGEKDLDAMIPATNQSRQDTGALLLFLGTPPKPADDGEVFHRMRTEALSGDDDDTGWIEFGADADHNPTPPPGPLSKADWAQVAKANPSYPEDTPPEAILRMRKKLGPYSFLREGLGIWDDDAFGTIPIGAWTGCGDAAGEITGQVVLSLDMAFDRSRTYIGVCGGREDGRRQVEVIELAPHDIAPGADRTEWLVTKVAAAAREWSAPVAVATNGNAAALIPLLQAAGVEVLEIGGFALAQACGNFFDAVVAGTLAHLADDGLTTAVRGAQRRTGESFVFTRKGGVDISPLYAALLALWGWTTRNATGDVLQHVW